MDMIEVFLGVAAESSTGMGKCAALARTSVLGASVDSEPLLAKYAQVNSFALKALVNELEVLKDAIDDQPVSTSIYTNNEFICNGINKWMSGWAKNGWHTKGGGPVKMRELWEKARDLLRDCNAVLVHVPVWDGSLTESHEVKLGRVYYEAFKLLDLGKPAIAGKAVTGVVLDDVDDEAPWSPSPPPEPLPMLPGQGAW